MKIAVFVSKQAKLKLW